MPPREEPHQRLDEEELRLQNQDLIREVLKLRQEKKDLLTRHVEVRAIKKIT